MRGNQTHRRVITMEKLTLEQKTAMFDLFLTALKAAPDSLKKDLGGEEFATEVIKGTEKFAEFFQDQ
jgi:hypothetical protein